MRNNLVLIHVKITKFNVVAKELGDPNNSSFKNDSHSCVYSLGIRYFTGIEVIRQRSTNRVTSNHDELVNSARLACDNAQRMILFVWLPIPCSKFNIGSGATGNRMLLVVEVLG